MPFIHIKSLSFEEPAPVNELLEGISTDFASGLGIGIEHVTATWEFFLPGHYAVAGKASSTFQPESHPIIVDLLSPDFNGAERIETMLKIVAESISKRASVSKTNILINHRRAYSGMVYDSGEVVHW